MRITFAYLATELQMKMSLGQIIAQMDEVELLLSDINALRRTIERDMDPPGLQAGQNVFCYYFD